MNDESMSLGATRIADFVSDFSPARRSLLRKTLDGLTGIPDERRKRLLVEMSGYIKRDAHPNEDELKGFPENYEDLQRFLSAATTLLSFLRGGEAHDDILVGLSSPLNLNPATKAAVESLLIAIEEKRLDLDAERDHQELADATLPSLEKTDFSVDLRVQVKDGQVVLYTPVVIAHFDTDALNQEFWFQMSKDELEKLRKDLETISVKLNALEKWAEQKS